MSQTNEIPKHETQLSDEEKQFVIQIANSDLTVSMMSAGRLPKNAIETESYFFADELAPQNMSVKELYALLPSLTKKQVVVITPAEAEGYPMIALTENGFYLWSSYLAE